MEVQFKIKQHGADETIIKAGLVDVIAWEAEFNRPSSSLDGDNAFARDYVWLAWHSSKRQNLTQLDFMEWAATLEDVQGSEPDLVPLESPAPIGSSPDSQ
jgi:hypothetical protein